MLLTVLASIFVQSVVITASTTTNDNQNMTSAEICGNRFQALVHHKNNKHITLADACTTCGISQPNCHCLSSNARSVCVDVHNYNRMHWKTCQVRMVRAVSNFAFGVIGVIGNFLVVLVTVMYRKSLSRCQHLIGALAASDFVFSVGQTIRYVPLFWSCQWKLGANLCTGFPLLKDVSSCFALGFILIIATERYLLIVHPHRKPLTNNTIVILCLFNVIFGVLACMPKVLQMNFNPFTGQCRDVWESKDMRLLYDYAIMVIYFVLPISAMVVEHVQIVRRLRQQVSKNAMSKINDKNLRRNRRITRVLIAIIIGYVFLVFPRRLVCILRAHVNHRIVKRDTLNTALRLFSCIPYGFHVACNPIIYSFVDRRFRKNVQAMLPFCLGSRQATYDMSATVSSTAQKHSSESA